MRVESSVKGSDPVLEPDSTLLPLPLSACDAGTAVESSPLENEVIAWFDQMRNPLLRYAASFGLSEPDGEDIVQEVFLSLFGHLQRGKSRANLRSWLFRVAHNLALKRCDWNHRNSEIFQTAAGMALADPDRNPEAQFAKTQIERRVLAVWQAMPELDRRCLSLRAEGLRYREIAEILEVSLGAVSLSLTRSLTRFACATQR